MTTEELQKILQTEGYIAHVDDDGDLTFKAQGRTGGYTASWKKAIVTLTADSKTIAFFDGLM